MSLRIGTLRFHNFRNYHDFELSDIGSLTIFVGPNAVGKTNIIEGIQLLTSLDSFRNATSEQLVRFGEHSAFLRAHLTGDDRDLEVALKLDERGRHFQLNGKQRPRAELVGQLPAVLFTPDDLQLVKGGPEQRRAAMDALGSQVSRNYLAVKRDYEKLLRQKNQLLKDEMPASYLESVNEVLAKIGAQYFQYRMKILLSLQAIFSEKYRQITGAAERAEIGYRPSWCNDQDAPDFDPEGCARDRKLVESLLSRALESRAEDECRRHISLVGPHRDKPFFLIEGRMAADFASQGQQRSLSIAYKLSELQIVEDLSSSKPILLLDDVMSELDATRRATLVDYVQDAVQTFITTTNIDYFTPEIRSQATIHHLG